MHNFRLLTAHIKFHRNSTLKSSFCWKYIKFQLKKYKGVLSHDTEKWCKIRGKTALLLQKWQKFGEFWPEHPKVWKIFTLISSFCAKYTMFDLKKYRRVTFHETEEWCKIWKNIWLEVCKMTSGIWQIFTRALESLKIGILWDPYI